MDVKKKFVVGDDWLYFKIYTGYRTADLILSDSILPLTTRFLKNGLIEKWFFIRFSDPNNHLRLRFFSKEKDKLGEIVNEVYKELKPYVENGLIWKVQIDTYDREINRYGNNNIEFSEHYFFQESKMIVKLLNLIKEKSEEDVRWLFGLRAIDSLLSSFKYDDENKLKVLGLLKKSFEEEFGKTKNLKKQLDSKYRRERLKIEAFLNLKDISNEYYPIISLLYHNEKETSEVVQKTLMLQRQNELEIDLNVLLYSHIHMLMNRLFRSNNRFHELVIYYFLFQIYKSKCARKRLKV